MQKTVFCYLLFLCVLLHASLVHATSLDATLNDLQQQWAVIKYQTPDKGAQEEAISKLVEKAEEVARANPGKAEPLIWESIIVSTQADIESNIGSLKKVETARDLLLQAEKINPKAMHGLIYTSLGVLYYQVPGAPLSFGDSDLGKQYLEKGLAMNPNGLDANFFYGDFLYQDGDSAKAKEVLTHALAAPARPHMEVADAGRKAEAQEVLDKIDDK